MCVVTDECRLSVVVNASVKSAAVLCVWKQQNPAHIPERSAAGSDLVITGHVRYRHRGRFGNERI